MDGLRYFILGLDPGTTTAVCALDFDGDPVFSTARKHFSKEDIISFIVSRGRPSLIATDRAHTPSLVSTVARSFGSPVFNPETDMSRQQKHDLTETYEMDSTHERDAMAAAIHAFKSHRDMFRKVDNRVASAHREELKDTLLRDDAHNISAAIRQKLYA